MGILTECTTTVSVSEAVNAEFDCDNIKNAPYDIWRNLILPSKTETYRLIDLFHFVMDSYPYHIPIAYILQQVIEHLIHASYKMI